MYVRTYVCTYVCMYVSVTLRNVNLQYRLGMSISCQRSRPGRILDTTCITQRRRFLAMEDGEDCAAGPLQHTYLAKLSAEVSAERSRRLATLTKNKTKRSVHHRSQESKRTRIKEFNSRKHILEILHSKVF